MKTSPYLRTTFSFTALGAAFAAQAISMSLVSSGSFAFDGADPNLFTQDEKVLISDLGAYPALDLLHVDGVYDPFSTVATYTSGSGSLTLDLMYENTSVGGFGVSTDSGTWTIRSGTGSYVDLTGSGSYSISYNAGDDQFASTTVVGDIEAVPEPATLVALSLGALGLLRRRKVG